jgi:L-alanine-DL-glutamate epimerase-like enolase superfamily enzyme
MIERVTARAFTVPTDGPESDGTLEWDSTTLVVVTVRGGGETGLGYGYGPPAVARVVTGELADVLAGRDPLDVLAAWTAMRAALRNAGQAGIGAIAVSVVDIALHDLRARLLGIPLVQALGRVRERIEGYGSGGFCTYGPDRVAEQLGGWAAGGLRRVKMKVGRDPAADVERLRAARDAIGDAVELMVDANGAFTATAALAAAADYAARDVGWLEEPVSSDDLDGLRRLRAATGAMSIAAGEYCWSPLDAQRLLDGRAVDVLQLDVTRCSGITGTLQADVLADAHHVATSLHCAPAIAAHVGCAMPAALHLEDFHDHQRIEAMLFDHVPAREGHDLLPDPARPGHGLRLREDEAARFEVTA